MPVLPGNIYIMMKVFLTVFILLFTFSGNAQKPGTLTDNIEKKDYSSLLLLQRDYLFKFYYGKVGGTDELINGKEYIPYYSHSTLKPLLFPGKIHTASIVINGRKFDGINLEYDTFLDEVVYFDYKKLINSRIFQIALNKYHIDNFSLYFGEDSLMFRYFRSEDGLPFNLKEGFYEVVYDGITKYITRHKSDLIEQEGLEEYSYKPEHYLKVGDIYTKVKSSKGLVGLLGDKSAEMKKFMRTNNIKIRKANKRQIDNLLRYYDTLIPSVR